MDSTFSAEIDAGGYSWVDWFTWEDEGTEWRREEGVGFDPNAPLPAHVAKKPKQEKPKQEKPPKTPKPPTQTNHCSAASPLPPTSPALQR